MPYAGVFFHPVTQVSGFLNRNAWNNETIAKQAGVSEVA